MLHCVCLFNFKLINKIPAYISTDGVKTGITFASNNVLSFKKLGNLPKKLPPAAHKPAIKQKRYLCNAFICLFYYKNILFFIKYKLKLYFFLAKAEGKPSKYSWICCYFDGLLFFCKQTPYASEVLIILGDRQVRSCI